VLAFVIAAGVDIIAAVLRDYAVETVANEGA
jgi:hypothetical protein